MKANSELTLLQVKTKLKFLLGFNNNWRQRYVEVYEHPTDQARVISVGFPFGQLADHVICDEERSAYDHRIKAECTCPKFGRRSCPKHKDYD